jgi:hypothetical protein
VGGHYTREIAITSAGFARAELDCFFRRREERDKSYCSTCLVVQLARRGTKKVAAVTWTEAVEEAFTHARLLQVRSGKPCEVCKKPGLTIGA